MSAPYGTIDAAFDAEAMGRWLCPRHGESCDCCYECGLGNGHHETWCPLADEPESNFEAAALALATEVDRCSDCGRRLREEEIEAYRCEAGEFAITGESGSMFDPNALPDVCEDCAEAAALARPGARS